MYTVRRYRRIFSRREGKKERHSRTFAVSWEAFGLLFETTATISLCPLPFTAQVQKMLSFDITPQIHMLDFGAVDFVSRLSKCLHKV